MRLSRLSAAGALVVVLSASAASADETTDSDRAAALFAEGRQRLAAGDFAAACPMLAESQALAPAADTALDLGVCYEKASQAAFKTAHEMARANDPGSGAAPALAVSSIPEAPSPGQPQRAVGLAIGGVGLAGLIAGVVTGVMAKTALDDAVNRAPNAGSAASRLGSAHDLATASTVSFIAGAAALGGGAVVFFTAPKAKPAAAVGLGPATEGAGLAVAGRF